MICKKIEVLATTNATLTTYIMDDEQYARRGTCKPAVIVCPGGGYTEVSHNEGEPVALAFAARGYHAFVLDYSVKIEHPFPQALCEVAAAIKLVREHADEWRILPDRISVCGFSAGGHLAASLGVYYREEFLTTIIGCQPQEIMPNALILGYPALSLIPVREGDSIPPFLLEKIEKGEMMDFRGPNIRQIMTGKMDFTDADLEPVNLLKHIHGEMPPVFVFGSATDPIIPVNDLTGLASLCKEVQVPCELHLFGAGPHGQGLFQKHCGEEAPLTGQHMGMWFELAMSWLEERWL
jgi:acetyl esterase/lipase